MHFRNTMNKLASCLNKPMLNMYVIVLFITRRNEERSGLVVESLTRD